MKKIFYFIFMMLLLTSCCNSALKEDAVSKDKKYQYKWKIEVTYLNDNVEEITQEVKSDYNNLIISLTEEGSLKVIKKNEIFDIDIMVIVNNVKKFKIIDSEKDEISDLNI